MVIDGQPVGAAIHVGVLKSNSDGIGSKLFTKGHWQALVNIITNNNNNNSSDDEKLFGNHSFPSLWIIDTRASNHMTGDITFLKNVRDIPHWPIGLPNERMILQLNVVPQKLVLI